MPPVNVCDSPTTTTGMPNWRISPLQYQHGASVVDHDRVAVGAPAAGAAEGVDLGVRRRVAALHAPVVPAAEQRAAAVEQRAADRDAALGQPGPGLLYRDASMASCVIGGRLPPSRQARRDQVGHQVVAGLAAWMFCVSQ